jgi:hypothetical protein
MRNLLHPCVIASEVSILTTCNVVETTDTSLMNASPEECNVVASNLDQVSPDDVRETQINMLVEDSDTSAINTSPEECNVVASNLGQFY